MNFILFHIGSNIPIHLQYCIKQIVCTNPDSIIYIITDQPTKHNGNIKIININNLQILDIGDYYKYDVMGPLFRNSMLRIFYLEAAMKQYNIVDVIHFDNDVLIYENINIIYKQLSSENFYMTSHSILDYVFGFSYIKNYSSFSIVNQDLHKLIIRGEKSLQQEIGSMPHEMRLLKYINDKHNGQLIKMLPILPTDINYEYFKYCFDPSSYGQYIGGAIPERDKYIGANILDNKITILFENKKPFVNINSTRYPIFNLHIHNKQLQKFI